MEPNQTPLTGKLQLRKQAISNLSRTEMEHVNGGEEAAVTTSFGSCTGFLCCEGDDTNHTTETIVLTIILTLISVGTLYTVTALGAGENK